MDELRERGGVRVAVVADVRLYREGLRWAVLAEPGLDDAGAFSWADAFEGVQRGKPDIVLADVHGPDALSAVSSLTEAAPGVGVVAVAVPELETDVIEWAEAGAAGYVTREDSLDRLIDVVRSAARGEAMCSPRVAAALLRRVAALAADRPAPGRTARLTRRELEVIDLVAAGLSNKEIGQRLHIELATVKNHVHNILAKLEVRRRSEAVAYVRGAGRRFA